MAKAQAGKTYAQVVNGRCHKVFTAIDLPEWNENDITVVDVTGNVPNEGDVHNGGSSFSPYTPSPEELAKQAQAAQDAQDKADAKADAQLKALLDMTPAQIDAWMASNVTTIAQARVVLARLAKAVAVIARRELR